MHLFGVEMAAVKSILQRNYQGHGVPSLRFIAFANQYIGSAIYLKNNNNNQGNGA